MAASLRHEESDQSSEDERRPSKKGGLDIPDEGGLDIPESNDHQNMPRSNDLNELRELEDFGNNYEQTYNQYTPQGYQEQAEDYSPEQQQFFYGDRRTSVMEQRTTSIYEESKQTYLQVAITKPEMCEQEVQTDEEPKPSVTEKKLQTDDPPAQLSSFVQTEKLETKHFSFQCGTTIEDFSSIEIQAAIDEPFDTYHKIVELEIIKLEQETNKATSKPK